MTLAEQMKRDLQDIRKRIDAMTEMLATEKQEEDAREMLQELKERREKGGVSSDTARTNPELLEQISKDGD
jgi:hypothetical protein